MEIQSASDPLLRNPEPREGALPFCCSPPDMPPRDSDHDSDMSPSLRLASNKRKLTNSEWLETVLKVTDQLRWTEVYYDEATEREYPVAPGNPNKVIDELLRDCPVGTAESAGIVPIQGLQQWTQEQMQQSYPHPQSLHLDDESANKE
jgi:hypothetical protein